jgi:hypothetical protein
VWLLTAATAGAGASAPARSSSGGGLLAGRIFTVAGTSWMVPRDERRQANLATDAQFDSIGGLAALQDGGFLVAAGNRVWRVRASGRIELVAGNGKSGFSGDNGPATAARLSSELHGVAALPDGGFLIADMYNDRVRRVWPDGHISTVAGGGEWGVPRDGGSARAAFVNTPMGVAALPDDGFLIAEFFGNRVRRVWPDGHISTVAGTGDEGFSGDGGPATAATLGEPKAVAALPDGGFLIAEFDNDRVRRVWPDGHIATVAGGGSRSGDGGLATAADIGSPDGVAVLPDGGFAIAEEASSSNNNYDRLQRVWPDGHISTVAGGPDPVPSYFANGAPASGARFDESGEGSVAVSGDGSIFSSFGADVRLVIGPGGTDLLVAGIRPLGGTVLKRGYRLRLVLNKPARVTVRLYASPKSGPVAITRTFRRAGETTLTVASRSALLPGLYAVDVRAGAGLQSVRALGWVYLGGRLASERFVSSLQTAFEPAAAGFRSGDHTATIAEPVPPTEITSCHRFSGIRIDCGWTSYDRGDWTAASFLTRQGQIYTRKYGAGFKRHPHWRAGQLWESLDLVWGTPEATPAPTSGLG